MTILPMVLEHTVIRNKAKLDEIVETFIKRMLLFGTKLKTDLKKSALGLSGGQQQRLMYCKSL